MDHPVDIRFYWNDGLDIDNHAAIGKMIVDAMKGYILPDDNRKWVKRVSHEFWEKKTILVEVIPYGKGTGSTTERRRTVMDRLINAGDLERYAVVLDNGHKYIPWVALAEVPTADAAAVLTAIAEGCPEDQFPDLSGVRFLLQRNNIEQYRFPDRAGREREKDG